MEKRKVEVTVTSNNRKFIKAFSENERKITRFGRKFTRVIERSNKTISRFHGKIGKFSMLIGGLGAARVLKGVVDLDARLRRVKIQAGLSLRQMLELKQSLFEKASITHQGADTLLGGIDKFIEKTGDFEAANASIKAIGIAATATGAAVDELSASAADLYRTFRVPPKDMLKIFDILAAQGKMGAFTLQNMASQFPELLPAAAAFDVRGIPELAKFGALLQIFMSGTGSPERTKTSIIAAMTDIIKKSGQIKSAIGFDIFDPEKSLAAHRHVLKDVDVVFKEIISRTKGDPVLLQKIFGAQAMSGINALVASWTNNKGFGEFDRIAAAGGNGLAITRDFADYASTTASQLKYVQTQANQLANDVSKEPISNLNKILGFFNKRPTVAKATVAGGVGLGALASSLGLISPALAVGAAGLVGYYGGELLSDPFNKWINKYVTRMTNGRNHTLGGWIYDELHGVPKFRSIIKPVNKINLIVNIEKDGRVRTNSDDTNTKINVKRGDLRLKK